MGNVLGNLAALVVVAVGIVISTFSFRTATLMMAAAVYGILLFFWVGDLLMRPSRSAQFTLLLSNAEFRVLRKYHTHLRCPAAGQAMSAMLNLLRLAGVFWGATLIWRGEYLLGAVLLAYFFVVGGACLRFDPVRYMLSAARSGNDAAREQLLLLERVRERREQLSP